MSKTLKPNYVKIYKDLIKMKFPEKESACQILLQQEYLSNLDVLKLEHIIFGKAANKDNDGKYRSYDKHTILKILDFQKANNLNNTEVAKYYGMSRNTITKWKKMFL